MTRNSRDIPDFMKADLHPRIVRSPDRYPHSADGPVQYVVLVVPRGLFGYLWFSDAEGAAGHIPVESAGVDAVNAHASWVLKLQEAKAEGLAPSAAVARSLERGNDHIGRAETGSILAIESLAALHKLADPDDQAANSRDPLVRAAMTVAREAHAGQVDKSGADYLQHPFRVMSRVHGVDAMTVALLHDVVEDSEWTLDDLRVEGFGEHIVAAVDALSKRPGEALEESIARVNADRLARIVKYADVADNSDPSRLAQLDPELRERLTEKYRRTRELLDAAD